MIHPASNLFIYVIKSVLGKLPGCAEKRYFNAEP